MMDKEDAMFVILSWLLGIFILALISIYWKAILITGAILAITIPIIGAIIIIPTAIGAGTIIALIALALYIEERWDEK